MSTSLSSPEVNLDDCYAVVQKACTARGVPVSRLPDRDGGRLGVELLGASRTWQLYVETADNYLRLPPVRLADVSERLAHVSYHGAICLSDGQGESLDATRRNDLVAYSVLTAYDLLERSAVDADGDRQGFFNEYEGYWLELPRSVRRRRVSFEVDGCDRIVTAHANLHEKEPSWVFTERTSTPPDALRMTKTTSQRALYLNLPTLPLPPVRPAELCDDYLTAILALMTPDQEALWDELLWASKRGLKSLNLLVSTPRAAGGLSLVGMQFSASKGELVLPQHLVPFVLRRHTLSYMRERGGASLGLAKKHVVVIGVGAVGASVADVLASAGVGRLTLVDDDTFSEDNVFRHVLPPTWIDGSKTGGLKYELTRHYPGVHVTSKKMTAQQWFASADFPSIDGVVVAIGSPTVERLLAKGLREGAPNIPIVLTWLEALDLGGHSVLTRGNSEGCMDCLYRDEDGVPSLLSRTAFLKEDQVVTKNLTGCTSTFVPYGVVQARKTALLAAEQILAALSGRSPIAYQYWRGTGEVAKEQGLLTTPWWEAAMTMSAEEAARYVFDPCCGKCRRFAT